MWLYTSRTACKGAQCTGKRQADMFDSEIAERVSAFCDCSSCTMAVQVLLRGTAKEMLVDIACLNSAGAVVAHLPAVRQLGIT